MKRSTLVLVLAATTFFAFVTPSHSQFTITQLWSSDTHPSNLHINDNGYVVWDGHDGSDFEIFLYDGTTTTQLTNNGSGEEDYSPHLNNNGHVVWAGGEHPNEIFLYDGTSTTQLTNNDYEETYPQINDDGYAVWMGCEGGGCYLGTGADFEIFLYDGTSTTQLTNNSYYEDIAQINDDGYAVWMACEGAGCHGGTGGDFEVFLYDGTSTTRLTDNAIYQDIYPDMNDRGWVVWSGCLGWYCTDETQRIFLYDGTSTTEIANNDLPDELPCSPQINNRGYVVWHGYDGTDLEVFLYDGISTTQITNNSYDDQHPQINENGWVVWQGCDGGECYSATDGDYEIFLYDGTSTSQLTNNDSSDYFPKMNNNGYVVWYATGSAGVFLAVPDFCIDNDADGYGNPAHAECTYPELDCDNYNSNIYPTNSNTSCDCQEPIPQGTTENCSDLEDNDCDGWIDDEDPNCVSDADGDGMADVIDVTPSTHSNDFSDESLDPAGVTSGVVTNRGDQLLTVMEEANPSGVKITADSSGGAAQARVSACDALVSFSFDPGDEAILTCGSADIEVLVGPIEGMIGPQISISVPGGAAAKVTEASQDQYDIDNTGASGTISVIHQGEIAELDAGESVSITTPGACSSSAHASTHRISSVYGSKALGKHLACFLLPLCAVVGLTIWRRRK